MPRPAPISSAASAQAFQDADADVVKARILLQNPDFLIKVLKQDSDAARSLADVCASFSSTLSMELDEKNRAALAPTGTEAPATRMRM